MEIVKLPKDLVLNTGKQIDISTSKVYVTSKGVTDIEKDGYVISLFKEPTGKICAEVCYTGITTYSDFDNWDLSEESYRILKEIN
jgi:hypothetical protein